MLGPIMESGNVDRDEIEARPSTAPLRIRLVSDYI